MEHLSCPSLILICYMNLSILIYTAQTSPLIGKPTNRLEIFNEFVVCCVTIQMFLFTDWVLDKDGSPDKDK